MGSFARHALSLLASTGFLLALAATARSDGPLPPLAGPAFAAPPHLRLILAGAPPAIVDVDTGVVTPLLGITTSQYAQMRLVPMARGALAIVHEACDPCATTTVHYSANGLGFRIGSDGAIERLGAGWSFVPSRSGAAVWVLRRAPGGRCRAWLVPSARASLPAPCGFLEEDGASGLLIARRAGEVLLETRTGRVRPAIGGGRISARDDVDLRLTGDGVHTARKLVLAHLARGTVRRLRWPSILAGYGGWSPRPRGHLLAVEFGDPAYPGPAQAEDVWLLDTTTATFSHLPGFPAQVDLKFSSWRWSDDGRLVLLLRGGGRTVVAVWTPGAHSIPVVPVELPPATGGNGAFVALAS